jgi:hypothetical protein
MKKIMNLTYYWVDPITGKEGEPQHIVNGELVVENDDKGVC